MLGRFYYYYVLLLLECRLSVLLSHKCLLLLVARLFSHAQGTDACQGTRNINVGTSSCHGSNSCRDVFDSTIDNESCHGELACNNVRNNVTVGN